VPSSSHPNQIIAQNVVDKRGLPGRSGAWCGERQFRIAHSAVTLRVQRTACGAFQAGFYPCDFPAVLRWLATPSVKILAQWCPDHYAIMLQAMSSGGDQLGLAYVVS